VFLWSGRFDESRAHLSAVCAQHAARGEDHAFAWARFTAVWLETWSGDLVAASSAADEAWEGLRLLDTGNGNALALTARAQVDACAGRAQAARRGCREALAYFGNAGWQTWSWFPIVTLGFLELSVGDYEAAAGALEPLAAMAISTDLPDPAPAGMLFAGDAAEALVGVGRSEEAETITSLLEERGEALDRPWAIAVGARCRGLLLAAGGDVPGAEQALERALVTHERLPMPIERARSLLVLGRIRRRLRKRRAAKTALGEALAVFEAVGSPLWAEQARAEIGRLGFAGARRTISRPRRSASPASRPRVSRTERWRHPFSSVEDRRGVAGACLPQARNPLAGGAGRPHGSARRSLRAVAGGITAGSESRALGREGHAPLDSERAQRRLPVSGHTP
jgi:tetratricopeptide (TPR) repeat protein